MPRVDFHYIKTGTGELSGPSFVDQTEQAINELGVFVEDVENTANSALSQAQNAQQTANAAQQTANNAVSQAQNAQASADAAQQAADQAQTTADNALEAAQTAGDEAGTKAPIMHASTATTYGVGSSTLYGHVQLSDATNGAENAASGGTAATPYAVAQAMTAAQTAQTAANSAQQVGNSAQQTANQAQTEAEAAQNTANSVQTSLNQAVDNITQQITALTQMQDFVVTDTAIDVESYAGSFSKLYLTSSASASTGLPSGISYPCFFWTEKTADGNTAMMYVLSDNVLYSQSGTNTTPDADSPTWSFTGWQKITYTAATTTALGVVKPDGTTVEVAADGTLSVPEYEGATASDPATSGLVPPATSAETESALCGDGTFRAFLQLAGGTMTGGLFGTAVALSGSAIDVSAGSCFTKTITASTTFTITGAPSSAVGCFSLILTNGGSQTVTWPASVNWTDGTPPDLTASGIDVITFLTADGGTTWYGVPSVQGAA